MGNDVIQQHIENTKDPKTALPAKMALKALLLEGGLDQETKELVEKAIKNSAQASTFLGGSAI